MEARKEALENDKRRMLSTWAYPRQAVDIFHGILSLRSEMVALVSIIAFTGGGGDRSHNKTPKECEINRDLVQGKK